MSRPAFLALADDLTGAAELAAIGRRMGLRAIVCTGGGTPSRQAELAVYDTDSRLCSAAEAARRVRTTLEAVMSRTRPVTLFKKVDSVLRGPVAAEIAATVGVLGQSRVLLVPANPSLGRTVCEGIYRIDGVPVAETAFARDPHHPARSSHVIEMLGGDAGMPVSCATPALGAMPTGIVVGDATCIDDLDTWAHRLGTGTLAAGGAEFFAACLRNRGCSMIPPSAFPHLGAPVLAIAGTATPTSRANLAAASAAGVAVFSLPESLLTQGAVDQAALLSWIDSIARALQEQRAAIVSAASIQTTAAWVPDAIRRTFAMLATRLHRLAAFKHLVVEGGATAAAVAHALGWTELLVLHEWAPGVASLRPPHTSNLLFTIKPGSYAWPEELWRQVVPSRAPTTV